METRPDSYDSYINKGLKGPWLFDKVTVNAHFVSLSAKEDHLCTPLLSSPNKNELDILIVSESTRAHSSLLSSIAASPNL